MAKISVWISLCFLLNSLVDCDHVLTTLFVVHRHGNRNPNVVYPNDPYKDDTYFPDGVGQLTIKGKQRMYKVGQFLRNRYSNFLSDNVHEVYVRSSGKERCLESVELLVNGAYKPTGRWIWNKDVNFQPVPIQSELYENDPMNMFSNCLAGAEEFEKIFKSKFTLDIHRANKEFFKNLTVWTGKDIDHFLDADYIYDTLEAESNVIENFTYPEWATEEVLNNLKACHLAKFKLFGQTKRLQRLRLGVFLNELTTKIREAIKPVEKEKYHYTDAEPNSVRKLNIFSTHDIVLYNLLEALDIPTYDLLPDFGGAIIIELHQDNESSLNAEESSLVKLFYLNNTKSDDYLRYELYPLQQTSHCLVNCTVKEFLSTFSNLLMTPDEWNDECKYQSEIQTVESSSSSGGLITAVVIESIAIVLLVAFIVKRNVLNR